MKKYAAIVLAAGASKRLGKPKQLLPYKNSTLLNNSIEQLQPLDNIDIYVILGAYSDAILLTIHKLKVTPVFNPNWEEGMGSSLSCGIKTIQEHNDYMGALVTLSDLPYMDTQHFKKLIANFESGHNLVTTEYPNFRGVPCMIHQKYFSELENLSGDEGAKTLMKKYKKEVSKATSETPYFDIDTDESYQKLVNLS